MKNTFVCRVNLNTIYNADAISESNKTPEESQKDCKVEKNKNLEQNEHSRYIFLLYEHISLDFNTQI